jgi:hypothetical protein
MVDELPCGSYHKGDLRHPKDTFVNIGFILLQRCYESNINRDRIDALSASGIDTGNAAHAPTHLGQGGRKLERTNLTQNVLVSTIDRRTWTWI